MHPPVTRRPYKIKHRRHSFYFMACTLHTRRQQPRPVQSSDISIPSRGIPCFLRPVKSRLVKSRDISILSLGVPCFFRPVKSRRVKSRDMSTPPVQSRDEISTPSKFSGSSPSSGRVHTRTGRANKPACDSAIRYLLLGSPPPPPDDFLLHLPSHKRAPPCRKSPRSFG